MLETLKEEEAKLSTLTAEQLVAEVDASLQAAQTLEAHLKTVSDFPNPASLPH